MLRELEGSPVADWDLTPVVLDEAEGCVCLGERELPCQSAGETDWSAVDVVLLAAQGPAAARLARGLVANGRRVVAIADILAAGGDAGLTPMPAHCLHEVLDAPAEALLRVLRPLLAGQSLLGLSGFVAHPVAMRGRVGIEELVHQTRALFALETVEPEAFPVQIAFNLLPQVGALDAAGSSTPETALARAVREAFGEGVSAQFTAVWIPAFHGGAIALHGRSAAPLDLAAALDRLKHAPGVRLMQGSLPGVAPTPATDGVDSTDVLVGRVRLDVHDRSNFALWLTYDHPRLAARSLLAGLEKCIESGLN